MTTKNKLCAEIAEAQHGIISREQALRAGMSQWAISRRLRGRQWLQVLPGVYRFAGVPASWEQSLLATTLWGGDGCVVSHGAAAALHGLSGFPRGGIHVQSCARLQHPNIITHRVASGLSRPTTRVRGIPVASVTRTLIDLAGTLPRNLLERALDEAIRRGMTDVVRLKRVLSRSGMWRSGGRVLRELLQARDVTSERSDSELEDKLIRLIRSRRIPAPVVHFVVCHDDRWIGEVDLAYPQERIAIEAHGYGFHSTRMAWENDQRRENELALAGWKVLKATSRQLEHDPDSFIESLRSLIISSRADRQTHASSVSRSRAATAIRRNGFPKI